MKQTIFSVLIVLTFSIPAQAKGYYHYYKHKYHHLTHHYSHYLTQRHFRHHRHTHRRHIQIARHSSLPGPCRVAASMGGPCGCWAAHILLGRLDHVWRGYNLWLANDWLRFPHVAPEVATAVVWPGRHVAPVVPGTYRKGTIMVRDSWATHPVRTAGLVFVDPLGRRHQTYKVSQGWPL